MLFSALISRIFGVKRTRDELARKNCMTGREFFSRFPSLHGFLLDQFQQAEDTENTSKEGVTILHPSLFPCLLLLSRLYPSPSSENDPSMSMEPFLPHVIRAGGNAVYKTRSMAAMALVALVPPSQVLTILEQLLAILPGSANQDSNPHPNIVHGVLMQVQCLLTKYCSESSLSVDNLRHAIIPRMQQLLWLASRQNQSYVTRAAFMAIISDFIVHTRWQQLTTGNKELRRSPQESQLLCSVVDLAVDEISNGQLLATSASSSPGFYMWQTTFVTLCLKLRDALLQQHTKGTPQHQIESCHHENAALKLPQSQVQQNSTNTCSSDHMDDQVLQQEELNDLGNCNRDLALYELGCTEGLHLHLLRSPFSEVRVMALTNLIRTMVLSTDTEPSGETGGTIPHAGVSSLEEVTLKLMDMMRTEQDHECLAKVCESLSLLLPAVMSSAKPISSFLDVTKFFGCCLDMAEYHNAREEIVSAVVSLTGSTLPHLLETPSQDTEGTISILQSWIALMVSCSHIDRSRQLRLAVARLLDQSACLLFSETRPEFGHLYYSLWSIFVSLLQDDDREIQHAAGRCIGKLAASVSFMSIETKECIERTKNFDTFCEILDRSYADPNKQAELQTKNSCHAFDWPVLLGLEEGQVTMTTMSGLLNVYKPFYNCLLCNQQLGDFGAVLRWELHPSLSVHLAPLVMCRLSMRRDLSGCIKALTDWAVQDLGGRESAQPSEGDNENEDKLFDRGEANTNYESVQLKLAAYQQITRLRTRTDRV